MIPVFFIVGLALVFFVFACHSHGYGNVMKRIALAIYDHGDSFERRVEQNTAVTREMWVNKLERSGAGIAQ